MKINWNDDVKKIENRKCPNVQHSNVQMLKTIWTFSIFGSFIAFQFVCQMFLNFLRFWDFRQSLFFCIKMFFMFSCFVVLTLFCKKVQLFILLYQKIIIKWNDKERETRGGERERGRVREKETNFDDEILLCRFRKKNQNETK